jgi:hypothetical protein
MSTGNEDSKFEIFVTESDRLVISENISIYQKIRFPSLISDSLSLTEEVTGRLSITSPANVDGVGISEFAQVSVLVIPDVIVEDVTLTEDITAEVV